MCNSVTGTVFRYVKSYEKLARTNIDMNYNISFHAVNCVTFSSVCRKKPFDIRAYPTLMGFNIEPDSASGKILDRSTAKAQSYFDKHMKTKNLLPHTSSSMLTRPAAAGDSVHASMQQHIQSKRSKIANALSHAPGTTTTASPVQSAQPVYATAESIPALRLHDALSSLHYMLLSVLPTDGTSVSSTQVDAVVNILRVLIPLLPSCQSSETALYASILTTLTNANPVDALTIHKIRKSVIAHKFFVDKESSCLGGATLASNDQNSVALVTGDTTSSISWLVCKYSSASLSSPALRGSSLIPGSNSNVGDGYTCGLWMLFHYLTGNPHYYLLLGRLYSQSCFVCSL
jgi:hypothetical protein